MNDTSSRTPRRRRISGLSVHRLIPNLLTTFALCAGLTSIRFSVAGLWELAVTAIVIAAILDFLDGGVARLLKASSPLGAQLDSLSDFVCFGVAPAILLYLWSLNDAGSLGWLVALAFSICAAMRLARFNVRLESSNLPAWARAYFTGVPSPAGAGLALLPVIVSFQTDPVLAEFPVLLAIWTTAIGLLMVSNLPTFSLKKLRIPERFQIVVLVGLGLSIAALFSAPWQTLTVMALAYLATLPISYLRYRRQARAAEETGTVPEDPLVYDEPEDEDQTAELDADEGPGKL
jgi:CDP-diacylglycerol--serine O-phosphatidyltransferase